jgi:antagonist of KipI
MKVLQREAQADGTAAGEQLGALATPASFKVLKPGLFSSFQDLGRHGFQQLGVPVGGVMDELSHRLANRLVGNADEEATLEITQMGPTLRFTAEATIACCGAELSPSIDGLALPLDTPTRLRAGATLVFGRRLSGVRCYLAVRGGYALQPVMGSCSTYERAGYGGHAGRALRKGDVLGLKLAQPPADHAGSAPGARAVAAFQSRWLEPGDTPIRVMPGREWAQFSVQAQRSLLSGRYRVGALSDRMGYRLEGEPLPRRVAGDLVSEAVCFGTMQVPSDGQPIVLMAEHQTTGGYPRIAQVASVDLPRLAQYGPGDVLWFDMISIEAAQALLLARARELRALQPVP